MRSCRPYEWLPGPCVASNDTASALSTYAPELPELSIKAPSLQHSLCTASRQEQLQALLLHLTRGPTEESCQIRVRDHVDELFKEQQVSLEWLHSHLHFNDWTADGFKQLLGNVIGGQQAGHVPQIIFLINSEEAQRTMVGVLDYLRMKVLAKLGKSVNRLLICLIASCNRLGFAISDTKQMKAQIDSILSATQFTWTAEPLASTAAQGICDSEALACGHGLRPYVALSLDLILSPNIIAGSTNITNNNVVPVRTTSADLGSFNSYTSKDTPQPAPPPALHQQGDTDKESASKKRKQETTSKGSGKGTKPPSGGKKAQGSSQVSLHLY